MKRMFAFVSAVAAIALTLSCNKDNNGSITPENPSEITLKRSQNLVTMTFTGDALTKTSITSAGAMSWVEGDQIKIVWGPEEGDYAVAEAELAADGSVSFTAEVGEDGPYFAVYPSTAATTFTPAGEGTSLSLSVAIPTEHNGSIEQVGVCSAYTTKEARDFGEFKSCVSLFQFTAGSGIDRVEFSAGRVAVAGKAVLTPGDEGLTITGSAENNSISVDVSEGGEKFLAVVPGCEISNLYFHLGSSSEWLGTTVKALSTPVVAERAKIRRINGTLSEKMHNAADDWYIEKDGTGIGTSASPAGEGVLHALLCGDTNKPGSQNAMKWVIDNKTIHVGEGSFANWGTEGDRTSVYADLVDGIKVTIEGVAGKTVFTGDNDGDDAPDCGVFKLNPGTDVTIRNVKFYNTVVSSGFGGAIHSEGVLTLENCAFEMCTVSGAKRGGAINIQTASTDVCLTATNCSFTNCSSSDDAGAIRIATTKGELTACTFTGNQALRGGAILIGSGGCVDVKGCTFTANRSTYETLAEGGARNGGGAICNTGSGTMTIGDNGSVHTVFSKNEAVSYGGAICTNTGLVDLTNVEFTENTAHSGGAIFDYNAPINATGCAFNKNIASTTNINLGGGAFSVCYLNGESSITGSLQQPITLTNCTADGNVGRRGGFFHLSKSGTLTINGGTYKNNESTGNGGGVIMTFGSNPVRVNGATFIGNKSSYTSGNGAGSVLLSKTATGTAYFNNCLFTENTCAGTASGTKGGVISVDDGTAFLGIANSTFYKNEWTNEHAAVAFSQQLGAMVNCTVVDKPTGSYGVVAASKTSQFKMFNSVVFTSDGTKYSLGNTNSIISSDGHNVYRATKSMTINSDGTDLAGAALSDVFGTAAPVLNNGKVSIVSSIAGFNYGTGTEIKASLASYNADFATWLTSINAFADRGEGQWNPGA